MSGVRRLSRNDVVPGGVGCQGWWLVADDGATARAVAGPFVAGADARWAAAAEDTALPVRPVYGIQRADGTVSRRPSPEDWAWLTHLGEQLDRLPDDWDAGLDDDDPLGTLVVEVTAALAEAGLPLHDALGPGAELGGACLTPEPALGGIVVTWRQHDRASVEQLHGPAVDAVIQQVMNRALADVLYVRGFRVEQFGDSTGSVVRAGH